MAELFSTNTASMLAVFVLILSICYHFPMKFIRKQLKNIESHIKAGRILVIYGPRQSGKTTMLREFFDNYKDKKIWLQGDDRTVVAELASRTIGRVAPIIGGAKLVIIDEAQYIPDTGRCLKFLADTFKDKIFVVTGSSAFGLLHSTKEPLTGRADYLNLYPLDMGEIDVTHGRVYSLSYMVNVLVYGSYPAVCNEETLNKKETLIRSIAEAYLYKDILEFDGIRNHDGIRNILKLLALQIGHDVSINEIATKVKLARTTVENYIQVLEKSFIIASSQSVGTFNERNEITKNRRYYFVDLGIRNAIISNFASVDVRGDIGELWESFVFIERLKKHRHNNEHIDMCFWRTYEGKEIDIIEKKNDYTLGIECKWSEGSVKDSLVYAFKKRFNGVELKVVNKDNWTEVIL